MNTCDMIITRSLSIWRRTLISAAAGHRAMGGTGAVLEAHEIVAKALDRAAAELDEPANARAARARDLEAERDAIARHADRVIDRNIQLIIGNEPGPLEFDDTVASLKRLAKAHGWDLKSWGLTRLQPEDG